MWKFALELSCQTGLINRNVRLNQQVKVRICSWATEALEIIHYLWDQKVVNDSHWHNGAAVAFSEV